MSNMLRGITIKITTSAEAVKLHEFLDIRLPSKFKTGGIAALSTHVHKNNFRTSAPMPWYLVGNSSSVRLRISCDSMGNKVYNVDEFIRYTATSIAGDIGILGGDLYE